MNSYFQQKKSIRLLVFAFLIGCSMSVKAQLSLPALFSNHMILQREKPLKIWGWATPKEKITVLFNGQKVRATTDQDGRWTVILSAMEAGGPYEMTVSGSKATISFTDVLLGDIWLCSGQSNMEMSVFSSADADKEIANANYPGIRLFTVQRAQSYFPAKDVKSTGWQPCTSETATSFSAVAYYFARKVYQETGVPTGLIHSSWGGTVIQAWTSWDSMSKNDKYREVDLSQKASLLKAAEQKDSAFQQALISDKGIAEQWFSPDVSKKGWLPITLPASLEQSSIGNGDGVVWFSRTFELPASFSGKKIMLSLGHIDDMDDTYINGKLVGSTDGWNIDRWYAVDGTNLAGGKNVITIKVTDRSSLGGFFAKPGQMFLEADGKRIYLEGEWNYKVALLNNESFYDNLGPNSFPSQLFNAMIFPLVNYSIKGALWYQGESNVGEAYRYRQLFPSMISDWRKRWGYDFPFFWVQLANFMQPDSIPSQSEWAELREAQHRTLSVAHTGEAVIIDIGEANDIHPHNKQDVGKRLALSALKNVYGKDIAYSGPLYTSMDTDGKNIILTFSQTGSGLYVKDKYGYVKGFAVAGKDQKFYWAQGTINGDSVKVWSDKVREPVAVRYAWGNNPDDAGLYNSAGLPASPFRTDDWEGITAGKK